MTLYLIAVVTLLVKIKGRFAVITALAEQLHKHDCDLNFQIVRDNTSKEISQLYRDKEITYEQNLANARETDCIVDITQDATNRMDSSCN